MVRGAAVVFIEHVIDAATSGDSASSDMSESKHVTLDGSAYSELRYMCHRGASGEQRAHFPYVLRISSFLAVLV